MTYTPTCEQCGQHADCPEGSDLQDGICMSCTKANAAEAEYEERKMTNQRIYWIENEAGETLVEQQCMGMGSHYSFCSEMADGFTSDEASKLSTIYGGMIVPAPSEFQPSPWK